MKCVYVLVENETIFGVFSTMEGAKEKFAQHVNDTLGQMTLVWRELSSNYAELDKQCNIGNVYIEKKTIH